MANVKYFLRIADLNGGAKDKQHLGWIDLLRFDFPQTRKGGSGANGTGAGKITITEMEFVMLMDLTGRSLLHASATGKHFTNSTVESVDSRGLISRYLFEDIRVSD